MRTRTTKTNNELGAAATEYIIILVLVAIAAITAWDTFGENLKNQLSNAHQEVLNLETDRGE